MDIKFRLGEWLIQADLCRVSNEHTDKKIQPKLMRLLVYLASHAGEVVSKEEINAVIWENAHVTDDALTHSIFELRKALGDNNDVPLYIRTIPKKGYQLIAPVAREEELSPDGSRPPRLAILPFVSVQQIGEDQKVADAFVDKLVVGITKLGRFRVISRTAVWIYWRSFPSWRISHELNVDLVLEGTMRVAEGLARVTMGLLNAADEHIWAEAYECRAEEIASKQNKIVETIIRDFLRGLRADQCRMRGPKRR